MKDQMLEKLMSQFPVTIDQFQKWFIHRYNIDIEIFNSAPFDDRCKEILRFLGLPLVLDTSTGKSSVTAQIKASLQTYENFNKKPVNTIDPLKAISILPYDQRQVKNAIIFENDHATKSLRNALVMINDLNKSLRDSLKDLPGVKKIVVNDSFWEDIKREKLLSIVPPF